MRPFRLTTVASTPCEAERGRAARACRRSGCQRTPERSGPHACPSTPLLYIVGGGGVGGSVAAVHPLGTTNHRGSHASQQETLAASPREDASRATSRDGRSRGGRAARGLYRPRSANPRRTTVRPRRTPPPSTRLQPGGAPTRPPARICGSKSLRGPAKAPQARGSSAPVRISVERPPSPRGRDVLVEARRPPSGDWSVRPGRARRTARRSSAPRAP